MGEPESPPNKQQIRSERSTNALLDAAAELIVEGGLGALTFAKIGDRAGYSRGMVTARFGSKDGLIDSLIERIVTTWSHRNVIPHTKGRTGLEGTITLIDAIRVQAAKDPRGLRVLYSLMFEATGSDEDLRLRFAKFHEVTRTDFARYVHRGQRDGSIRRGLSPDPRANCWWLGYAASAISGYSIRQPSIRSRRWSTCVTPRPSAFGRSNVTQADSDHHDGQRPQARLPSSRLRACRLLRCRAGRKQDAR